MVSADKLNVTEMTNAIEGFTSEYQLYVQNISSGTVNTASLDEILSGVYEVANRDEICDISLLESTYWYNWLGLNVSTKYPVNEKYSKKL